MLSTTLAANSWTPLTATPTVTSIDATWERVTYSIPTASPRQFLQIQVTRTN
jgi:hypothetical protein